MHFDDIANVQVGVTDNLPPDIQAMLMAMYSRSYGPIESRLPQSEEDEQSLRDRLRKFYLSYAHKSVGQLGFTTIWFEGVSQLAAKAIEDDKLFNGQESSTRYIDFSTQPMVNFGNETITKIQEAWRALYIKAIPATIDMIKAEYPIEEGQNQTTWENTIKARAFDICRCLLPAGVTTNVGLLGTFDMINDRLGEMMHHPSSEVNSIAVKAHEGFKKKYPDATPELADLMSSFSYMGNSETRYYVEQYDDLPSSERATLRFSSSIIPGFGNDKAGYMRFLSTVLEATSRKKFQKLTRVANNGRWLIYGLLDFGSFRDLQRHRNGTCHMPLLTTKRGFNSWYLDKLPLEIAKETLELCATMELTGDRVLDQYAIPMGYNVNVVYECDTNQLFYLLELRTGKTVHQTLRRFMQSVLNDLSTYIDQYALKYIHADMSGDNFTLKRGTQTFDPVVLKP